MHSLICSFLLLFLGIDRTGELTQCKKCDRWMIRQDHWARHKWESQSLLSVCLKKIAGLQRQDTKILDAGFIWTEPHSMRLKVYVHIERGVLDNKVCANNLCLRVIVVVVCMLCDESICLLMQIICFYFWIFLFCVLGVSAHYSLVWLFFIDASP